jgi:site-specific DNA-cytosine methylase
MQGGHQEPKVLVRPASIVGRRINEKGVRDDYNKSVPITQCLQVKHNADKTGCITTVQKDNVLSTEKPGRYIGAYGDNPPKYRKLTPRACMRLQGFPTWVIDKLLETEIVNGKEKPVISNSQLYKMTGNGWAIPVITHILQCLLDTGWMQD